MRVALSVDMEGIAQLVDWREVIAACDAYWQTGAARMTADAVAAAQGLLEGGAEEVVVFDNHASGNPCNIDAELLPAGARVETWNTFDWRQHGIDAALFVGYHARCGIPGFLSHTYLPGLRLRVGDELISEAHGRAWSAAVPLLGIVGNDALGRTLGSLHGTPFLAVQESSGHDHVRPVFGGDEESFEAIRVFARDAAHGAKAASVPAAPGGTVFAASLAATPSQAQALVTAGFRQARDTEFELPLETWLDAREPLATATSVAWEPWLPLLQGLDLTSPGAVAAQPAGRLQALDEAFERWVAGQEPEWL